MKYLPYIIVLLFLGCQDVKYPDPPANLITENEMVTVITEAYISNAARSFNANKIRTSGLKLDSLFYAKNNIDSLQFAESNAYYASNLETYKRIFEKVKLNLEAKKEVAAAAKKEFLNAEKEKNKNEEIIDSTEIDTVIFEKNLIEAPKITEDINE